MALPLPPAINNSIPNNPFYSPESMALQGSLGSLIVGSGFSINYNSGTINAVGGGSLNLTAGPGISLSPDPITSAGIIGLDSIGAPGTVSYPTSLTVNAYGQITAYTGGAPSIDTLVGTSPILITGTGTSRTISLGISGVTAGSYTNPTISISSEGTITSAANGPVPVTAVTATAPLSSSGGATPDISLNNSGVSAGNYSNPTLTIDAKGIITAATSGLPPVTSVTANLPLTSSGGTTPSISLSTTGVIAGNYDFASVTVDAYGRVIAAADGVLPTKVSTVSGTAPITVDNTDPLNPIVGISAASTTGSGAVQLNNTLSSTSDTEALTAAQGKNLQDQISALGAASNLTLAGTFDATTSQMLSVSLDGSAAGFTVGSDLIAPAPGNADYFVIVTTPGSYSPPGGGGPYTANQGDWFLSNGTVWQFLNVGTDLPIASTGTAGIVELADVTETQAGTSTTLAVTPAGAAGTYIPLSSLTAKGVLIGASGANTLATVPAGTSGQFLVVDPSASSGLNWQTLTLNFIPESTFTAAGELIAGTGAGTYAALPVGTDGQSLIACAAASTGLCWANISVSNATPLVAGIVFGCTSSTALTNTQFGYCSGASGAFESVYVGYQAAPADTGACNTFVGYQAGNLHTTGGNNVAIGHQTMQCHVNGVQNVAIGQQAMQCANGLNINNNIAIGRRALCQVQGRDNIAIGYTAGCDITTGCRNFAFGPNVQVPSPTGCCQLAVGFASGQYWVVGTSDKSICLGGALRDCTNSTGTAGQVLCSTGTAIQWSNPSAYGDTPVGAVNWFASTTAPAGWLVADGTAVSRTTYAALFAVIGTTYGTGDGSTTFNLPDLRGQFLRGWDAAGGTARGCDPGRAFGSSQGFALQTHCHEMQVISGGAGRPEWACPNFACPAGAGYPSPTGTPVRSGGFTSTNGSTETRPTNVAMLPCIKWQVTTAPSSCGIPCSCITAKGAIITGNTASTPVALPSGINGQVLTVNTACSLGLEWAVPSTSSTWTSAGTIQSVGISATATAPTVGTTLINNVRYRQIGPKEWEVQGVLHQTGAGTAGNGYYLFTLPAGLQFDVSSPYQKPYTGVPDNNQGWYFSGLINSWTMIANVGSSTYGRASITPYDATRYRISGNADYGVPNYLSQGWYQLSTAPLWYKWGFTFETP